MVSIERPRRIHPWITVNGVTLSGVVQISVNNRAKMIDCFYSGTSLGIQNSAPMNQIVFCGYPGNAGHWNTCAPCPGPGEEVTPREAGGVIPGWRPLDRMRCVRLLHRGH